MVISWEPISSAPKGAVTRLGMFAWGPWVRLRAGDLETVARWRGAIEPDDLVGATAEDCAAGWFDDQERRVGFEPQEWAAR